MRGALWTFTNGIYPSQLKVTDKHKSIPSDTPIILENEDVYPT
jgi:hypothetical protein